VRSCIWTSDGRKDTNTFCSILDSMDVIFYECDDFLKDDESLKLVCALMDVGIEGTDSM